MDFILDLFTKKELMIIGVVIGVLVLIVLILTFIDILSRKKKENAELDEMFNEFDRIEPVEPIKKKKVEVIENKNEESLVINVEETKNNLNVLEEKPIESKLEVEIPKFEEIKNDLSEKIEEKVEDKVEYIEPLIMDIDDNIVYVEETKEETKTKAQEELLKIEESLKNPKSLEDTLYNLEVIEEENAIISYQELIENTSELNAIESDTGDEPISLKEILNMYDSNEVESLNVEDEMSKTTINEAYKGDFTSSPYLSPIVGFDYDESKSCDLAEIQLENTANLEKLDKEMRKTNEFLSILNDLKKNLD